MFKQTLLAGAVLAVVQAASAATIIDDFGLPKPTDTPDMQMVCDQAGATSGCFGGAVQQASSYNGSAEPGRILGNHRELFMQGAGDGSGNYTATVGGGFFSVATPSNPLASQPGWLSIMRWDGAAQGGFTPTSNGTYGIVQNGFTGVDLTDGGQNIGLSATILEGDDAFTFEIQVFSGAGNWTSLLLGALEVIAPPDVCTPTLANPCFPGPFNLEIKFDQFAAATPFGFGVLGRQVVGTGADFANVTAAQIIFRGNSRIDFSLDTLQAVPEPTSLALVGLGLLGAGLARRRAKAA